MVLCYVDKVLAISESPMKTIEGIKEVFKLKGEKAEVTDMYLGASIHKGETADGTACWEEQAIPGNAPLPRGKPLYVGFYMDANHAGNLLTRKSHTGIIIFVNNSPIIWYSKRQNTVESSSFGSKFIALWIATEMIEVLSYDLRMFRVPINRSADVFCNNQLVVNNVSIPSSVLNKKHNSICYHRFREAHIAGAIQVGRISHEYNKADIVTKTTIHTNKQYELLN